MFTLKTFHFGSLLSVLAILAELNKPLILIKLIKPTEPAYLI